MALGDFIKKDTYTTIERINYLKNSKVIEIFITVYSDSLKSSIISQMQIFKSFNDADWNLNFELNDASPNILKMGYAYLKKQDGFDKLKDI